MTQKETSSSSVHQNDGDDEKEAQRSQKPQKFSHSSRKILLVLLLCAAFFSVGVLLIFLLHLNQNQFFVPSASNFGNSTTHNNLDSDSCASVKVKFPADPCSDFYEFACAKGKVKSLQTTERHFLVGLKLILGYGNMENRAEKRAQNFYRSCVKAGAHPESMKLNQALNSALENLEEIPHGNLQEKLQRAQFEYGLSPFFTWSLQQDYRNPDRHFIKISSGFGDSISQVQDLKNFTNVLKSSDRMKMMVAEILGNRLNFTEKSDPKSHETDLEQLVAMERGIQKLSLDESELDSFMTLEQVQKLAGFINWKQFFNSGLEKSNLNFTFNDHEMILVWCPQCLSKLSQMLQNSNPEFQKLLDKYLIWQVGKEVLGKIVSAVNYPAGTASVCSILTENYFQLAVVSFHRRHLLKEHLDLETKTMETVQEMAENIREELILSLKGNGAEWLDVKSRDGAIEKARKTRVIIGYPEVAKSSTLVEESYKGWPDMNELDFIGNMLTILKVVKDRLTLLREPVDLDTNNQINSLALSRALTNNAYSFPGLNAIIIPARNLIAPNFSPQDQEDFGYGKIGFTIGHEFSHGIYDKLNWDGGDKLQRQNLNSNQSQSLWQTEGSKEEMKNSSSCLIHQFSKFSYPDGKFLNGTQTLVENFADNVGLHLATRAFFRLLNKTNIDLEKNPGKFGENGTKVSRVTDEKLFFTAFAQRWCTDEQPEFSMDLHSPEKFRILGTLQNSKAFSEAFNCPLKSPMNPEEKCSVF